ncbi:MAG: hypothetical protein JRI65_14790 [Deltaproteobacteria bacterium]|nr:hypothetical protein [Deltaproteobacteria bacterium]
MKTDKKLYEIALKIIQEMYAVSEPPLDFLEYKRRVDAGEVECEEGWYLKYRISEDDYNRVIAEGKKKYRLTKREEGRMTMVFLNWSPRFKD